MNEILSRADFDALFFKIFAANGLDSFSGREAADKYYSLTVRMLEVNEHLNLTAITAPPDVILLHYVDSLCAAKFIPAGARVIDIGTGAGFPAFPLALSRPDLKIVAADATAKRIDYVNKTAFFLGLSNLSAVALRAEEGARNTSYREKFDVAVSRAVAKQNILCEYCLPYVKIGGVFIAMKGPDAGQEARAGEKAALSLGGSKAEIYEFTLKRPRGEADDGADDPKRTILLTEKIKKTPENYPRNNSQISKKPLA